MSKRRVLAGRGICSIRTYIHIICHAWRGQSRTLCLFRITCNAHSPLYISSATHATNLVKLGKTFYNRPFIYKRPFLVVKLDKILDNTHCIGNSLLHYRDISRRHTCRSRVLHWSHALASKLYQEKRCLACATRHHETSFDNKNEVKLRAVEATKGATCKRWGKG